MPDPVAPTTRADAVAPRGASSADAAAEELPRGRVALVRGNALIVANIDGRRRRKYEGLSSVLQYGMHPSWSPDGKAIYVHSGGAVGALHRVSVKTGVVERLLADDGAGAQWYPQASATGVYFTRETEGRYRVWRLPLDGAVALPVPETSPPYASYYRPAASPDGRHLAVSVPSDGHPGVRVFSLPTGIATSPLVRNATAPRWSPDGSWVAFSMFQFGPLRMMRPDGSDLRTVGTASFGEWFDWTPDGAWLIGNTQNGVALVRIADGREVPLDWALGMWQPAVRR